MESIKSARTGTILTKFDPKVIRWSKQIVRQVRHRAKMNGVLFTLEPENVLNQWTGRCPVFGTPFTFTKLFTATSPSLDRIKPSEGYTPDNVIIISYKANAMKSDANAWLLRRLADWLDRLEWLRRGATV